LAKKLPKIPENVNKKPPDNVELNGIAGEGSATRNREPSEEGIGNRTPRDDEEDDEIGSFVSCSFDPNDEEKYARQGDYYECADCDQYAIHFGNPRHCENPDCPSNLNNEYSDSNPENQD